MARPRGYKLSTRAWDDILRLSGTNLTTVAERSGINRATLSGLVGGHHAASVPTTRKLAEALGVHAETLFPTLALGIVEEVAA